MDCASVITGIIVPVCSALFGGGLTLLGVWLTIKDQSKKEETARKAAARPWIFSCESEYSPDGHAECIMVPDADSSNARITGNIKNTDNGILILDYIKSEHVIYKPNNSNFVVEKNSKIELLVFLKDGVETLKDLYLYIKDVYGNQYRYELILDGTCFTLGKCEEV